MMRLGSLALLLVCAIVALVAQSNFARLVSGSIEDQRKRPVIVALLGPGMQTLDFAVVREFNVTERMKFQIRGEFFNALNQVNLGTPNRFVNTPQFGTIT